MRVQLEKNLIVPISLIIGLVIVIVAVVLYTQPLPSSTQITQGAGGGETKYYLLLFYIPGGLSERQVNITKRVLAEEVLKDIELHLIEKGSDLWRGLAKRYNVHDYPTLILFKGATILWRHEGLISEEHLRTNLLNSLGVSE